MGIIRAAAMSDNDLVLTLRAAGGVGHGGVTVESRPIHAAPPQPRKRTFHKKVKTGCSTCKIRRVRCDEQKPACNRCVSTGRKCDGYDAPTISDSSALSSSTVLATRRELQHPNPSRDVKLLLPRKNPQEIRSYRHFIDVTAPAVGGSFDAEFWLRELPRACLSDPAIWHAAVSLGSVHEFYNNPNRSSRNGDNLFAMEQFNAAIRCLTESNSPRSSDKWRALTVSVIFASICILEGWYEQSRMHYRSGCKLLLELEETERIQRTQSMMLNNQGQVWHKSDQALGQSISSIPVSISSLRSILIGFEIRENAIDGTSSMPSLMSQHDNFSLWKYYVAPRFSAGSAKNLTREALQRANCAAESLQNALILFISQNIKDLEKVFAHHRADVLKSLAEQQQSHVKAYREISLALDTFEKEFQLQAEKNGMSATEAPPNKSLLSLRLYQYANRFILLADPDQTEIKVKQDKMPKLCLNIINLAEQILGLGENAKEVDLHPPIMYPLVLVAHAGFPHSVRMRAVNLLRRPRLEGLWDTLMSASLVDATIATETAAAEEYRQRKAEGAEPKIGTEDGNIDGDEEELPGPGFDEEGDEINPLHRVMGTTLKFTGRREALAILRTKGDFIDGAPGRTIVMRW